MILGYNGLTTKYTTLRNEVILASRAGFESIELRESKIKDYLLENSVQDLKALLSAYDIKASTINSIEITLQHRKDEKKQQLMKKLEWMCRVAREIRADSLVTAPLLNDEEWKWTEVKEYLTGLYREMSDVASKYNIKLGFEIIALTGAMVPNLDAALEVIRAVERDNVGLCFDCFAFYGNNSKMHSIREIPIDKFFMVHLNDAKHGVNKNLIQEKDRRFPGDGEIDLVKIITEIKKTGYDGVFSLELITPTVWEWEAEKAINYGFAATKRILSKVY